MTTCGKSWVNSLNLSLMNIINRVAPGWNHQLEIRNKHLITHSDNGESSGAENAVIEAT